MLTMREFAHCAHVVPCGFHTLSSCSSTTLQVYSKLLSRMHFFTKTMHLVQSRRFQQNIKLGRLKAAWEFAIQMRTTETWEALGVAALELLDVDMAIAAYRQLGDASMVLSLDRIRNFEDKNLLAAHIMVLLNRDHAQAQVGCW